MLFGLVASLPAAPTGAHRKPVPPSAVRPGAKPGNELKDRPKGVPMNGPLATPLWVLDNYGWML